MSILARIHRHLTAEVEKKRKANESISVSVEGSSVAIVGSGNVVTHCNFTTGPVSNTAPLTRLVIGSNHFAISGDVNVVSHVGGKQITVTQTIGQSAKIVIDGRNEILFKGPLSDHAGLDLTQHGVRIQLQDGVVTISEA